MTVNRPYHTERPIVSASILGIMNTRLWLEPWSDPCLKSTEQQSQQAMGAKIANYGECQQAAWLRIKALFVWRGWSPLFIWSWPFFYTILDPRLSTTDYVWSRRYFRSTSSHRWSIKLIFSSLHSTLITVPLALTPLSLIQWFSAPPVPRADPAD